MSAAAANSGGQTPLTQKYSGDINAGFAFLLDCVVNLFVLSALLSIFGFPMEIIQTRIIPGALLGIVVGILLNVRMARRIAKETGNPNITAMPIGLDMPTTVGVTLTILGPLFLILKSELGDVQEAAKITWYVGMASTVWMGLIKFGLSFFGHAIQRLLPISALLGAMVGVAIVWLGANAVLGVFTAPEVGLIALAVMIYALIGGFRVPGALPGAVAAVLLGTLVFYVMGAAGLMDGFAWPQVSGLALYVPLPTFGGLEQLFGRALFYMAIIVPFALLITASTINLTAGANLLGDDLKSGELIRVDASATIIGAIFGNVVQTTPYFGHATYKRLGARTAYAIGVAAALTLGGMIGVIGFLIDVLPDAAIKPILIVVACDIVRLAFKGVQVQHSPAVAFAVMPAILNFAFVKVSELMSHVESGIEQLQSAAASLNAAAQQVITQSAAFVPADWLQGYILLGALSRGYILTGLLWAAVVAFVIDRQFMRSAYVLMISAALSLFGIIHSVLPDSAIYFPWHLELAHPAAADLPYHLAAGYLLAGLTILAFAMAERGSKFGGGVETAEKEEPRDLPTDRLL
jgi:AGZA family xanthine/uracil permease-like MFS transporter